MVAVDVRRVRTADVGKAGVLAGRLERHDHGTEFRYDPAYLEAGGPPVAWSLPLRPDPVLSVGGAVPPFFAGLLPEGRRLSVLWRSIKTSADDELSLLLAVGRDTVGDVVIVPAGDPVDPSGDVDAAVVVDDWSDISLAELLERSVGRADGSPGAAVPLVDRVALAGVQPKLSGRVVSLPVADRSGCWILKLAPPEYPHLVEDEAFFIDAARRSGLAVVDARVVTDGTGTTGLLVRRFDRVARVDGTARSLAQEDGCQVLGRYPADKYNLNAEEVVGALVSCTRAKPTAAVDLFRQLLFAYLTGDGDVHAKNLSVGQTIDGEWRVTPAYDLPSTRPYGDTDMALPIGGRTHGLTRTHLLDFARAIELRERAAARAIDGLLAASVDWSSRLDQLPFDAGRIRDLHRLVRDRRRHLS